MKYFAGLGAALLVVTMLYACGKDEKSSAERDKEVQKVLQEGAQKERKMYERMQKIQAEMMQLRKSWKSRMQV